MPRRRAKWLRLWLWGRGLEELAHGTPYQRRVGRVQSSLRARAPRWLVREINRLKRFDNAFRLQLHFLSNRQDSGLGFTEREMRSVGKWIALRMRWPGLAVALDSRPDLLEALHKAARDGNDDQAAAAPAAPPDWENYAEWFREPALLAMLNDDDEDFVNLATSLLNIT